MANPVISGTAPMWSAVGPGVVTLMVAPFNVGDLMVLAFYANGGAATGVSGGGVSSWRNASSYFDTTGSAYASIWWGTVSATGVSMVTVTNPGQGTDYGKLWAREFTAIGANWSAAAQNPAPGTTGGTPPTSGTTITYPTLTPSAGGNNLYVGAAWSYFGHITAGSTTGFLYTNPGADGPEMVAYNPSISAPTGPTATTSDPGAWLAVAAAFTAGGGTVTTPVYATAYTVLGGGSGSWVNPQDAMGPPDGSFAAWTAP